MRSYVVIEPYYVVADGTANFLQHYYMLLGKTFSFTPDEANVEDLAKACDLTINLFC